MGLLMLAGMLAAPLGVAAAQDPPTTFPGQSGVAPAQPAPVQPAQPAPAQPGTPQPAQPAAPQPAQPEPRLEAQEHSCETLFGAGADGDERDERTALGEGEECFREEQLHWRWELGFFAGPTREDTWDESLAARGYGPSDVLFGGETALLRLIGSYLALGARTSVRDLRWLHYERPAAAIFGWDLMLAAELRAPLGRRRIFSIGVNAAGGLGVAFSRLNEGRATDAGWRIQAEGLLSLRVVGPAAVTLRIGYDHFPVVIGDSLDAQLGGARFTLAVEIHE